jgi:hypothetical protein
MPQTGRSELPQPPSHGGVLGVDLDEAQYRLIRDLGSVVAAHLPIDALVCRGIWLRAVRVHQAETRLPTRHLSGLPPEARLEAARRIRDHFARLAAEHLNLPVDSPLLQRCLAEAEVMYREKYQMR